MATLGTIREQLREELKADRTGKIWSDSQLNFFINKSLLNTQIDASFAWNETEAQEYVFNITANTQEYDLPAEFGELELVILYDGQNQMYLQSTDFVTQRIQNLNASTSKPYNYYIRAGKIGFSPIPNSGYQITMYYRGSLAELTNDSDAFPLSNDFIQAVLKYAAYLAWSSPRGNRQTAVEKLADYKMELNYLLQKYTARDFPGLNYRTPRNYVPMNNYKSLNYRD